VICSQTLGPSHFADDYEALRSGTLDKERSVGHFGLVIVLREGLAAWIAHAHARPVTIAHATSSERSTAVRAVWRDRRADMLAVLASMVVAAPEERSA
jgi:hypothetical protein